MANIRASKYVITSTVLLVLGTACGRGGSTPPDSGPFGEGDAQTAAQRVQQTWQGAVADGFSGVVIVQHRGERLLEAAAGHADRSAGRLNTVETVFDMGSLTKQFTGALLLRLEEQGVLSLSDPLAAFFPEAPADKASITVEQLLTHTAGFRDSLGDDYAVLDRSGFLSAAFAAPLVSSPGERYQYSNVGYSMASAIAEIATGVSYEQAMGAAVFEPAGLAWTGYRIPRWSERPVAHGYRRGQSIVANELPWSEEGPYWNLLGNGGLLTTADDLLRWTANLDTLFSAEGRARYQGPLVDEGYDGTYYGYGWVHEVTPAGVLHWHDGGNDFYFAEVLHFRDASLIVVMLANEENDAAKELTRQLARAALPEPDPM